MEQTLSGNLTVVRIVGKKKLPGDTRAVDYYALSDGTELNLKQIAELMGFSEASSAGNRIRRLGLGHPDLLEDYWEGVKPVDTTWDRKRCKRGKVCCKDYAKCQGERLGLVGYDEWKRPEDTDECYRPEEVFPTRVIAINYTEKAKRTTREAAVVFWRLKHA